MSSRDKLIVILGVCVLLYGLSLMGLRTFGPHRYEEECARACSWEMAFAAEGLCVCRGG